MKLPNEAAVSPSANLRARWIPLVWGLLWPIQTAALGGMHGLWLRQGGRWPIAVVLMGQLLLSVPLVVYAILNRAIAPRQLLRTREMIVLAMLLVWLAWDILLVTR